MEMAESYVSSSEESGATEERDLPFNSIKKRKLYSKLELAYCGGVKSPEDSVSSAASVTFGRPADDYECSSDEATKSVASPDLENVADSQCEGLDMEISMIVRYSRNCSNAQPCPTDDICGDSEQSLMEPAPRKKPTPHAVIPRRNSASSTAEKMPSAEEIEEFFAAAERLEQKRFAEKYNYDIATDVPLEGKYEWVRDSHP